jgi:hypothetical protein
MRLFPPTADADASRLVLLRAMQVMFVLSAGIAWRAD